MHRRSGKKQPSARLQMRRRSVVGLPLPLASGLSVRSVSYVDLSELNLISGRRSI